MKLFRKDRTLTSSWDLVSPSISLVRENIWQTMYLSFLPALLVTVSLVLLLPGLMQIAENPVVTPTLDGQFQAGSLLMFVAVLWSILAAPGWILFQVNAIQGEILSTSRAFKLGIKEFIPFVLLSTMSIILIATGLLLFIIPGLFLIRGFYLAPYYLMDKNLSPLTALKQSYQDSKPVAGWIWATIGVTMIISLAGSFVSAIPVIGYLLRQALNYVYIFAPGLRYGEIAKNIQIAKPVTNKEE